MCGVIVDVVAQQMHQARVLRTLDSQKATRFARGLCIALGVKQSHCIGITNMLLSANAMDHCLPYNGC
jgi:hypothetical protein